MRCRLATPVLSKLNTIGYWLPICRHIRIITTPRLYADVIIYTLLLIAIFR